MANYLNNRDLLLEHNASVTRDRPTDKLVSMWQLLIDRSSTKMRYQNEDDREDCKAQALEDLLRHWRGFDPSRSSNYFAWGTSVAKNGFAKGWTLLGNGPRRVRTVSMSLLEGLENVI